MGRLHCGGGEPTTLGIALTSPDTIRGTGLDVRGPGLPPPHNLLTRLLHRRIDRQLRKANRPFLDAVNTVRSAYRLQPLAFTPDIYHTPPLTLAATAEPFEYPRSDWNPGMRFVGPLLWEPEPDAPDAALPQTEPLLLVATSSVEDEVGGLDWCRLVVDAFGGAPWQVVMTHRAPLPMPSLPPNIEVLRHARHAPLIRQARCVVCHGGAGIVHKALAQGLPVVAIPTGHDRFEVAQRLEHARAGVRLDPQRATPVALRSAVLQAQERRSGARRIGAAFAASGGASPAADEIEHLLSGD